MGKASHNKNRQLAAVPPKQEKTYFLQFSQDHMNVLNAALVELPVRIAMPVIEAINQQLVEAQQAEEIPASEESESNN